MTPDPRPERSYGTDTTDEWWTLTEITRNDDGTFTLAVVQVEVEQDDGGAAT